MKHLINAAIALAALALTATAQNTPSPYSSHHGMEYRVMAGFNIGASTPMGLPAEIRKIESYNPGANLTVGVGAMRMFTPRWGMAASLIFEDKGMKTGIEVKNYHLTMNVISGDNTGTNTGYYTGHIKNETRISYLTLPVAAVFRPTRDWQFEAGAYLAFALTRSFIGHVWDGHLREDPLHPLMSVQKAEYDYSDDIRRFDTGVTLGAQRRIYRSLAVHAALQWGVLSTLSPSRRKIDMNTYNVYLNIGLSYTL